VAQRALVRGLVYEVSSSKQSSAVEIAPTVAKALCYLACACATFRRRRCSRPVGAPEVSCVGSKRRDVRAIDRGHYFDREPYAAQRSVSATPRFRPKSYRRSGCNSHDQNGRGLCKNTLGDFQPIPETTLAMIELWQDAQDDIDMPRTVVDGAPLPIVAAVRDFCEELDYLRTRNVDILDPELVRAIDSLRVPLERIRSTPPGLEEWWLPGIGGGLVHFSYVLNRQGRPSAIIDPWIRGYYATQERRVARQRAQRQGD
jgi:hypothetical protein